MFDLKILKATHIMITARYFCCLVIFLDLFQPNQKSPSKILSSKFGVQKSVVVIFRLFSGNQKNDESLCSSKIEREKTFPGV
jgi:hypothetical protein